MGSSQATRKNHGIGVNRTACQKLEDRADANSRSTHALLVLTTPDLLNHPRSGARCAANICSSLPGTEGIRSSMTWRPLNINGAMLADRSRYRYASRVVAERSTIDAAVHRETLRMALHNSGRSVPLQLVAVGFFFVLGLEVDLKVVAVVTAIIGIAVAAWRYSLSRRYADVMVCTDQDLYRVQTELEANAALAGLMWLICTLTIYPLLGGTTATVFVVTICGSIAIAAFFMSLVGKSFLILSTFQLGGLIGVSLLSESVQSIPLAILAVIFGVTMYRASLEFRSTTTRAIRHSLEADAASELSEAREGSRGSRQPRQVAVPGDDEPRDPHADERRARRPRPAAPLGARCRASAAWCEPPPRRARR